ncbi:uncharacterized protein IWZ02DRAFT_254568 [Phyllosticta citriasiana]|uniref:uncharacterized protein n=1 Tax=Phyllosticta citriasiana TaxID=595635 RepID=UPI0030FD81A6
MDTDRQTNICVYVHALLYCAPTHTRARAHARKGYTADARSPHSLHLLTYSWAYIPTYLVTYPVYSGCGASYAILPYHIIPQHSFLPYSPTLCVRSWPSQSVSQLLLQSPSLLQPLSRSLGRQGGQGSQPNAADAWFLSCCLLVIRSPFCAALPLVLHCMAWCGVAWRSVVDVWRQARREGERKCGGGREGREGGGGGGGGGGKCGGGVGNVDSDGIDRTAGFC